MDQENQEPLSKTEVNKIRSEAAKAVWAGESYEAPGEVEETETAVEEKPAEAPQAPEPEAVKDPWEGVPVHIRTEIEQLRETVKGVGELSNRLKKAEQRIGAYDNKRQELEAALAEARAEKAQKTKAERDAETAEAEERWNAFKEDEPHTAEAIEKKLGAVTGKVPTAEELITAVTADLEGKLSNMIPKTEGFATKEDLITLSYPTWVSDVRTAEFKAFLDANPKYIEACNNPDIGATMEVLKAFNEHKQPKETPEQIKQKQRERLRQSATGEIGGPGQKDKPPDEMNKEELAATVGKKAYDSFVI